jgi:hypothetical protein
MGSHRSTDDIGGANLFCRAKTTGSTMELMIDKKMNKEE